MCKNKGCGVPPADNDNTPKEAGKCCRAARPAFDGEPMKKPETPAPEAPAQKGCCQPKPANP